MPTDLSRRKALKTLAKLGAGAGCLAAGAPWLMRLWGQSTPTALPDGLAELIRTAPRARFWISTTTAGRHCEACHSPAPEGPSPHGKGPPLVKCQLCARECVLRDGERGRCHARINVGGELRSLVYGRPISVHVDPIEKKPFYHFLPGSNAFSMATSGCPLRCKFCQNWEISQALPEDYTTPLRSPSEITSAAASRRTPVIAFTYNEPTVFTEYLLDIAREAAQHTIRSVLVSCGYMNEKPLDEMCDRLSAIKVDLKGINPEFYRSVCGAEVAPVLRTIKQIARRGVHLEIVNLVVPTLNDAEADLDHLARWLHDEVGPDVPVHFTRFHPDYQLPNLPPTPVATLERAREMAMDRGLHYAFVGNVPGHPGNHTFCPACKKVVIKRSGFFVTEMNLKAGKCGFCGQPIAGVWQ